MIYDYNIYLLIGKSETTSPKAHALPHSLSIAPGDTWRMWCLAL